MRTPNGFILWTAIVLHLSIINGQRAGSSPDMSLPLNEVIPQDRTASISDNLESQASTIFSPSVSFPWTDFLSSEVTPTGAPPAQSRSSPSAATTQTPTQRDDATLNTGLTASAPGSSATITYLKSTVLDSLVTTASAAPTFVSQHKAHQAVSTSTTGVSQTTQTPPLSTPTYPQTSQFVLTSSLKVTRPAPLKDQDELSELDVGDQESGKVPHRPASPLDPLLAALVTIFIICTAMVSAILFLCFRQRSAHPEFHRLQDLPMDDLLEDTPLSRYSY